MDAIDANIQTCAYKAVAGLYRHPRALFGGDSTSFGPLALVFVLSVLSGEAVAQMATHKWRDCHQNARRETVCRECWLEAGRRHCTQGRVMARVSSGLAADEVQRIGIAFEEGER